MAITETSSAFLSGPRDVHVGDFSVAMIHTVAATASASANATVVLGAKVQNQTYIMGIEGHHTAGAASCPVDIGYDDTISAFASQLTIGANANPSDFKAGVFPFLASVSDDAAALYRVVKFGLTPGTNTTGAVLNYNVRLNRNPYS